MKEVTLSDGHSGLVAAHVMPKLTEFGTHFLRNMMRQSYESMIVTVVVVLFGSPLFADVFFIAPRAIFLRVTKVQHFCSSFSTACNTQPVI